MDSIVEAYIQMCQEELEPLDEKRGDLRKAFGAVAIAGMAMVAGHNINKEYQHQLHDTDTAKNLGHTPPTKKQDSARVNRIKNTIKSMYKVKDEHLVDIAHAVAKYEDPVFPKAHHILAVISKESSFVPHVKSPKSNAYGLMQVIPKHWKITHDDLKTIDDQVKYGAQALKVNYSLAGESSANAFKAYYQGIGDFKRGSRGNRHKEGLSYQRTALDRAKEFKAKLNAMPDTDDV